MHTHLRQEPLRIVLRNVPFKKAKFNTVVQLPENVYTYKSTDADDTDCLSGTSTVTHKWRKDSQSSAKHRARILR